MSNEESYTISFVGLKNGIHHYHYEIDELFFKTFEDLLINACKIDVKVELEKRENHLIFNFYIDGYLFLECDRCLDEYKQEVFGDVQLIGKLIEDNDNNLDDIIVLSKNQDSIDLAEHLYDYILLSIPYQRMHSKLEDCNQEMVARINGELKEVKKEDIDPRWEILNKLKK